VTALPKPTKRGPKPKRRLRKYRKTSRAKLAREADKLWSLAVRKKGQCELCGERKFLQAAHGFSRRYRGTRWVLLNGFCLCRGCHVKYTHDPLGWDDYLHEMWGPAVYVELREAAQSLRMPRDMEAIVASLRTAQ
jgi:5-methylcytosine-specific restriction endonuclease McrA